MSSAGYNSDSSDSSDNSDNKNDITYLLHHPHDKTFKQLMAHPIIAKDMFLEHLPAKVLKVVDLNTLQLCQSSYIDERFKQSAADVVYRVSTIDKNDAYLYCLCEHQSTPDKNMALRFLKYTCCIMEDHVKKGHKHLPIVVPLLVYNGRRSPYPYSINLFDQFVDKTLAQQVMFQSAQLIDLTAIADDKILERRQADVFLKMLLKHMRARDFLPIYKKLDKVINYLCHNQGEDILKDVAGIILLTTQISNTGHFIDLVKSNSSEAGEHVMTLAQRIHKEGRQEGRQQGRQEGRQQGHQQGIDQGVQSTQRKVAEGMIRKGMDKETMSELLGLTLDQVEVLTLEIKLKADIK